MTSFAQETIGSDEAQIIQSAVDDMLAMQHAKFKAGTVARRDVHAKSHGTVRGEFRVLPPLLDTCAVGLFSQPATYQALVRLSNGAPGTGFDIFPDVRGIAVKLLGVPGDKLLPGEENSTGHDFLLANNPTFFVRRLKDFRPFNTLVNGGKFGQMFRQYPVETGMVMQAILKFVHNPLQIDYFSQLPYLLGEGRAVKYGLFPTCKAPLLPLPNVFDRDYMLHGAQNLLRKQSMKYTLCVQIQRDPETEPIEDSSVKWTMGRWTPVAELTISMTDQPLCESDGEALSFNPWRVLKEHRPLGWAGRLRRAIYAADRQWRQEMNEPS